MNAAHSEQEKGFDGETTSPKSKRTWKRRTMMDIVREAGMSKSPAMNALALARIPEDEFERMIESDVAPSVSEMVAIGRRPTPGLKKAAISRRATKVKRLAKDLLEAASSDDPTMLLVSMPIEDLREMAGLLEGLLPTLEEMHEAAADLMEASR